jgi:hypothetical protein
LNTQTLALFNKLKKELPEKCCNPGTLINTNCFIRSSPPKDEEKRTLQNDSFSSHASRKEESMPRNGANIRFKSYP